MLPLLLATDVAVDASGIDPTLAANLLLKGLESGNWWLIAGPAVALTVWALRAKIAPLFPAVDAFLKEPVPALLAPIIVSALGGLLTILVAGPVTKAALIGLLPIVLKVAFTAIASFVGTKKVAEQRAGAAAGATAKVPDVQAAVAVLNAPPTDAPPATEAQPTKPSGPGEP